MREKIKNQESHCVWNEESERRAESEGRGKNVKILVNVYMNDKSKIIYIILSLVGHSEVFCFYFEWASRTLVDFNQRKNYGDNSEDYQ